MLFYTAIALIPALLLLAWLYTRDKLHPEPKRHVYKLFLLGAGIVLPAGLIERGLIDTSSGIHTATLRTTFITAFFVAGMVEEFLKASIVERKALQQGLMKSPIDAIVYSGAVALGFAAVENILYVTSSGLTTAVVRSVTAVPAHFMFGIIMGTAFSRHIWHGRSKAWAYILPAVAHGIYDTFALQSGLVSNILLLLYLVGLVSWSLRQLDQSVEWSARLTQSDPS
ncbi:PrsW family intramembrane metalloprotease [Alicyclobacillus sp. SO9]|uniref:PrsW family intramembrane metalloprotease n=1 Tax=Alicyclobacillus sp. SO9 TaxID=2665646 RepID=UPI001E378C6B|nr:PrsW family glutamic-type intramembrane protease [Alicyclobacillus sp. SO9]